MKYYEEYNKENNIYYDKIIYKYPYYYIDNVIIKNNRAIHNDIVYYYNNKVINIKERKKQYIAGVLYLNSSKKYGVNKKNNIYYLFKPINNKYPNFLVSTNNKTKENLYVAIEFLDWSILSKYPTGNIINIIGNINNYDNLIKSYLYKNDLIYPTIKIKDIINLKETITNNYNYNVFSIDPPNCLDIDDACSFEILDNNRYKLGIHITDVSFYINNIDLFNNRLTSSIYYTNNTINMLPKILSEKLCSLLENTIKKCVSVIIIFNEKLEIISEDIELNQVYIEKNYSYEEAELYIKKRNMKYKSLINLWDCMIKYDNNIRNTHELIEKIMILCNKIIAEKLFNYDNEKTILRTHKNTNNKYYENNNILLKDYLYKKNLNKAIYSYDNINTNHESLNLKYYTHFTSPIRRFIDIINHINIKKILNNEELIKIDDLLLEKVNNINTYIKKFENDLKVIDFIYNNNNNKNYEGYIIKIYINSILIYIPELKIEYKYEIINKKLNNLYKIKFINQKKIIIKDNNNNILLYKKNQKINIKFYIIENEIDIFKKLFINIYL